MKFNSFNNQNSLAESYEPYEDDDDRQLDVEIEEAALSMTGEEAECIRLEHDGKSFSFRLLDNDGGFHAAGRFRTAEAALKSARIVFNLYCVEE